MVFRPAPSVTFEAAIGKTILQGPAYVTPPWFYVILWKRPRGLGYSAESAPNNSLIFDFQPYPKAAGLMPYRRFYLPSLVIEPLAPTLPFVSACFHRRYGGVIHLDTYITLNLVFCHPLQLSESFTD
jgi:hypothetical protein